jgi:integrase
VGEACRHYVKHMRNRKGDAAADDAAGRFARHVDGDTIAAIALPKLTARHVGQWRQRLEEKPASLPKRGERCRVKTPQQTRARSASANNRDMVALRAALNLALHDGYATTDAAWRTKLEPIANADSRRTLYLSRDQRRALIAALPADCAAFVTGLASLPLRPGALAALTVADFNSREGTLRIGKDKAGNGRTILLPQTIADLIRKHAKGKLPAAPLFARQDGSAWDKDSWKGPIRRAAAAAGLSEDTTAYTLRHCAITDLIAPRDAAGNEAQGLDLFSVAALSGTSVAMIEKHYGHLQQQRARDALAGLAL